MKQFGWGALGAAVACVAMVQSTDASKKLDDKQERELYKSGEISDALTNGQYGILRDKIKKWEQKIEKTEDEDEIEKYLKKIFHFIYVFYEKLGYKATAKMPVVFRIFNVVFPGDLEKEELPGKIRGYLDDAGKWASGDNRGSVYEKAEDAAKEALKFAPKESGDKEGPKGDTKKDQKGKLTGDPTDEGKKGEGDQEKKGEGKKKRERKGGRKGAGEKDPKGKKGEGDKKKKGERKGDKTEKGKSGEGKEEESKESDD